MLGESDRADVDLMKANPWENDRNGDNTLEPESGVLFASTRQEFAWLSVVVDKKNNLGPYQNQSGPPEETVGPLKGVMDQAAHIRVGEDEHDQKEGQDDPGYDEGGERDLG
jgi:hypothetical protein